MPTPPQQKSIFTVPPLIKALFDTFPLITYPAYPVPARYPKPTTRARLYAWTTPSEAQKPGGGYSFDPECLKWQIEKADPLGEGGGLVWGLDGHV
ncbi:hypothetical protein L211DRAFT_204056 [Terfezia boudieri ATCC MYA-4762]|uniref:Uncharacterized protein n=1 Tax=Terfezia boudieri ATCC MYA-4762 TaxID=1051890 RepID=A0A3N4LS46_9PEZI|nr:hypothetical protein L211DRAFT_204056 [Terfezia boudieri ATCC MYA-4762]